MPTILVIDDRPANREFLVELLGQGGNRTIVARDGAEGIMLAKAKRPDLVVTDIIMPTMDGYAFVRQLRAEPEISATPIIFYTATYLEDEARKLADACGVQGILTKPSATAEILAMVAKALSSRAKAGPPSVDESFDREHLHLITNKLAAKVDELDALKDALEELVAARTAALAAANEELRDLNRMKDEFLALVSHDLRSPLSGIELMSSILREEHQKIAPAEIDRILETMGDSARHMTALVSDLLDIANIESGQLRLNLTNLRIGDVVHASAKALKFNADAKGVFLSVHTPPEEPDTEADRLKLSQVFSNLMGNAIKFTPSGGEVRISVECAGAGAAVIISDTGQGIREEALPSIFEKFGARHSMGTDGERGTGLGLSIVRQLVELHGGRIVVTSVVGHGSTFTVHLPIGRNIAEVPCAS
jgi:signal transduction histidine kinase